MKLKSFTFLTILLSKLLISYGQTNIEIPKYQKVLDFEDAPEAFAIFEEKFLIVTHANFYIVKDFQKELIFKDAFWDTLYPNSIAAFNNANIFVGIRGGIVKIDLTNRT